MKSYKIQSYTLYFLLLSWVIVALSGCQAARMTKQLNRHNKQLSQIAESNMKPEQKFHALGTVFADVLDGALKMGGPMKISKYMQRFEADNKGELNKILKEVEPWFNNMNMLEKISFGASLIKKDYTKGLITLIPQFERKMQSQYKKYKTVGRLLNIFSLGLRKR